MLWHHIQSAWSWHLVRAMPARTGCWPSTTSTRTQQRPMKSGARSSRPCMSLSQQTSTTPSPTLTARWLWAMYHQISSRTPSPTLQKLRSRTTRAAGDSPLLFLPSHKQNLGYSMAPTAKRSSGRRGRLASLLHALSPPNLLSFGCIS